MNEFQDYVEEKMRQKSQLWKYEEAFKEQQILDHENDLRAAEISTSINDLMNQLEREKAKLIELERKSRRSERHYRIRQDMMYNIKNIIT